MYTNELSVLISLSLPLHVLGIDFSNNVCPCLDLYPIAPFTSKCYHNPDVLSNVILMSKRNGYDAKSYSVKTEDGYILTMFRISPIISNQSERAIKYPVLLQHGLICNSDSWVDKGRKSLGFNLADRGYDVWLGNLRGTTYSNQHEILSISHPSFWDYNLDTLAERDLRSQLNLIVQQTDLKAVIIGHSLGTTLPFMFASEFPEEASDLMEGIIALAPVAYLDDVILIEWMKPFGYLFTDVLDFLNIRGLFYQEKIIHFMLTSFCRILPMPCYLLVNIIYGSSSQFPIEALLLFFSYWPTGISVNELTHYLQIASSKNFQKFDYGLMENLEKYGISDPPIYNLTEIKVPVCLFYGEMDSLYSERNIHRLYNELNVEKCKYSVTSPDGKVFAHMDFLYSEHPEKFYKLFHVLELSFNKTEKSL